MTERLLRMVAAMHGQIWRDSGLLHALLHAHDLDGVLGQPWALEIKLTTAPSESDLRRLNKTADLIRAGTRVLVSRTTTPTGSDRALSTHLPGLFEHLEAHWS